jgi:hypothetical protein
MRVVRGGIAASILALVASAGCEVAIGDALPAFTCSSNDAQAVCPPGQICVGKQCMPSCVGSDDCPAGTFCDTVQGACLLVDGGVEAAAESGADAMLDQSVRDAPPGDGSSPAPESGGACRSLGCKCGGPVDCDSAICVDRVAVTSALYTAAGNYSFCSQPCCTSGDCPAGSVCFATDAGGNYCVKPAWLGDRSASLGTAMGGQTCSTGADCRSGLCPSSTLHCADTCCSATGQCSSGSGTTCVYGNFPGTGFDTHFTANCGKSNSSGLPAGSPCGRNSDCAENMCAVPPPPAVARLTCLAPCRSSSDCNPTTDSCWYLFVGGDLFSACTVYDGPKLPGAVCPGGQTDCGNDLCVAGTCSDVCYGDKDCTAVPGLQHCVPYALTVMGGGSVEAPICSK